METMADLGKQLPATNELSDAAYRTFSTTELVEVIFEHVSVHDLVRARRVCKRFDEVIMSSRALLEHKCKLFLATSTRQPKDFIVWRVNYRYCLIWQPYISDAADAATDFRARPIHELNPVLAQFEVHAKGNNDSVVFGFQGAIIGLNVPAFLAAIKDGSPWENMLLTQPGCAEVTVESCDDGKVCIRQPPRKDPNDEIDEWGPPILDPRPDVLPTGPGGLVTLKDIKRALLSVWGEIGLDASGEFDDRRIAYGVVELCTACTGERLRRGTRSTLLSWPLIASGFVMELSG